MSKNSNKIKYHHEYILSMLDNIKRKGFSVPADIEYNVNKVKYHISKLKYLANGDMNVLSALSNVIKAEYAKDIQNMVYTINEQLKDESVRAVDMLQIMQMEAADQAVAVVE